MKPPREHRTDDYAGLWEPLHAALASRRILEAGCVLAVSGGPDSMALFHLVAQAWTEKQATGQLVVAHLNHRLRGAESDRDEAFVRDLVGAGARHNSRLALVSESMDVGTPASGIRNLEARARRIRYRWLAKQASAFGVGWVLTGHTLDDQAETVLFHILRGSGLRGLRGMAEERLLQPGVRLLRPLLGVERSRLHAFLADRGLSFCVDSSNSDLALTRNRLRHELLPALAGFNPRIGSSLAELARQARAARAILDRRARKLLETIEKPRAGNVVILTSAVAARQPCAVLQDMLVHLWVREAWPRGAMSARHWRRLASWLREGGKSIDLPGGIRAVRKSSVVQLGPRR
jgi:tRNA(Ile)-lysidine synthase